MDATANPREQFALVAEENEDERDRCGDVIVAGEPFFLYDTGFIAHVRCTPIGHEPKE